MEISKWFGVLVVGGAMLTASACADDSGPDKDGEKVTHGPDAAEEEGAPDATTAGDGDGDLEPCFCDSQACCERHEDGTGTVQEGFECCWSTTC